MKQGKIFRDQGIEKVTMNNKEFVARMRAIALFIVRCNGTVTADDLRFVADQLKIEPNHHNAWGAVFNTRELTPIGYTQSTTPSCHARVIRIWGLA